MSSFIIQHQSKTKPKTESKTESKTKSKKESKTESKTQSKTESKTESKTKSEEKTDTMSLMEADSSSMTSSAGTLADVSENHLRSDRNIGSSFTIIAIFALVVVAAATALIIKTVKGKKK